nr:transposase [Butyricicoccus sp. Marseille-Q5471]
MDTIQEHNITEQTFYRWKSKYGGMKANDVKGLKQLENENRRLKELVAELTLDNHFLKDVLLKRTMTLIDDTTLGNTLRWQ